MRKIIVQIAATKEHGALLITSEVKDKVAYLAIEGYIARWGEASSKSLKNEVRDLVDAGATDAEVYLNTEGGSVFEATEMTNILKDAFGKKHIKVRVGALAASAGTYIMCMFPASAKKNSQIMIHKPMGYYSGNSDKIRQELKALDNVTSDYRKLYAKRTGKTEDEIDDLWNKGDHWMDAKEALKEGFIDSIEDEDEEITTESRLRLVAAAAPNIPEEKTNPKTNPNKTDMNKELLALSMGLPKDASEEDIQAKAIELKNKADSATALEAKLETQEKEQKNDKIKALLDKAEIDKKITGEQRPQLEAMANADFENAEAFIATLTPVVPIKTNQSPTTPGTETPVEISAEQKDWTYQDYLDAENGNALWAAFEIAEPQKAENLINAHYK